jgi:hypothetical protein
MFSLKIDNIYIPLPENQTFKWVKHNELFSTDLPEGEYSYPITFSIDSPEASQFFGNFAMLQAPKEEKSLMCEVVFNGISIETAAKLIIRKANTRMVQGVVLTGSSILAKALRETKVNQLDFGSLYIGDTHQDMVDHMLDTVNNPSAYNHVFAPVWAPEFKEPYGDAGKAFSKVINNFSPDSLVFLKNQDYVNMHATAYVPFIKLKYVLTSIIAHFGYKLDWPLMNTPDFQKIILINNKELAVKFPDNFFGFKVGRDSSQVIEFFNDFVDFNNDSTPPNFNDGGLFNLSDNSYKVIHTFGEYTFDFAFDAEMVDTINNLAKYNFYVEIWADNSLLYRKSFQDVWGLGDPVPVLEDSFSVTITSQDNLVGKNLRVRAYFTERYAFSDDFRGTEIKSISWALTIDQPSELLELKPNITYSQHLPDMSCSEFFNKFRKLLGAYISHVDHRNRTISLRQNKSIALAQSSEPLFSVRDSKYDVEISYNDFLFHYNFGDDILFKEPEYSSQFPSLEILSGNDDAEKNELEIDFAPIFSHTITTIIEDFVKIGAMGIKGSLAGGEDEPIVRIGFYHGKQPYRSTGTTNNWPLVTADQRNVKNQVLGTWDFSFHLPSGLWENHLKDWYQKMMVQEMYQFIVFPTMNEIIQWRMDKIDFYEHVLFIAEKVEFNLQKNKIQKAKVDFMRLRR